ncbi:MAG TPA: EthD family reductase [Steroidobacteraceae bacterium]|nr:EthD family reductase [Steroidobacteraceae bacterium]
MIKVSVLYPNGPGSTFDLDYYCRVHMPMVQQLVGAPLQRIAVEYGLAGGIPGAPPPFLASGHLYFASVDAFQSAFAPHADKIMADVPRYTNTTPVIQIAEVKL